MSYDEFATYDDIMEDLANDRDDSNDPEFRDYAGYCEHGTYVGGCGADYMCGYCEDGISLAEAIAIEARQRTREIREKANRAEKLLNNLLVLPECDGILAARMAELSSNINNPASRYGRTGWDTGR
ncbi:MAG TPA: hypothetical protein VFE08_14455 [Candidatus Sulfotelmatobacter sp.]|nr:hypothetical protein [Candidatus Sulfotelmatobacter sp.]